MPIFAITIYEAPYSPLWI